MYKGSNSLILFCLPHWARDWPGVLPPSNSIGCVCELRATSHCNWVFVFFVTKKRTLHKKVCIRKISIYFFICLLFEKDGFLCFTPPENEFGNQLFDLFARASSYESKKVSGRFPDVSDVKSKSHSSLTRNKSAGV